MNKNYTICFFFITFLFITIALFGNEYQGNPEQIPQGNWVLESVSLIEKDTPILISADKLSYDIPLGIEVMTSEITFLWSHGSATIGYDAVVKGAYLCFLFCVEWKINENSKLQLQWIDDSLGKIILIYNQN